MKTRTVWVGTFSSMIAGALLTGATDSAAVPWAFVGPRYQAMGGAGVAVADDSLASYWNPASLGYARGMDVQLPIGMDASIEGGALDALGGVLDLADTPVLEDALDKIEDGIALDADEAQGVLRLVGDRFLEVGRPGQSVQASIHVGLLGRYKRFGLSAVSLTNANVRPVIDLDHLRLGTAALTTDRIEDFVGSSGYGTPTETALVAEIEATGAIWTTQPGGELVSYAGQLVYLAEQAGLDTSDPDVRNVMTTAAEATAGTDAAQDLSENATGAVIQGLSTEELALSFGYALPMPFFKPLDKKITIGANLKYILGITYREEVRYNSGEDVDDILDGLSDMDNTRTSHNFGLDLGVAAEPVKWVRVGVVARNVNSPSFDTSDSDDLELEPQVRLGVAVFPIRILTLAADVDLTQNESLNVPGFESRLLSLGTELRIPVCKLFELDLRGGAYTNLAQHMNNDWGFTGGLGLRVWEISLDLSGGLAAATESFPTSSGEKDLPTRVNWAASLRWEHRF